MINGKSAPAVNITLIAACTPESIFVEPSKTYQIRVIGGMALSTVVLGLENHTDLNVIAADGRYTEKWNTDHIQIVSGQRFDFTTRKLSEESLNKLQRSTFWIQIEPRYRPSDPVMWACLSYEGSDCGAVPSKKLLSLPSKVYDWAEYALEPFRPNNFPRVDEVTRRVFLSAEQLVNVAGSGSLRWNVRNQTWYENTRQDPYLVEIYTYGDQAIPTTGTKVCRDCFSSASDAYVAKVGDVIEIVWVNEPDDQVGGFDLHSLHGNA